MAKTKVHGEYIADDAIDSQHYADGSIDTAHIADAQVTTAKITDANVTTAKLADDAVTSAKIDTNIDIAGTFDVTGATTLDAGATIVGSGTGAGLYLNGTNSDSIAQGNFVRYGTNFLTQSDAANDDLITYAFNGSTFVNAFNIQSDGKVGIGTTSPDGELHVESSGNGDVYVERTSGAKIHLQAQSALGNIGTASNHDLGFMTNASVRMRINSSGNVGIGTASPAQTLSVNASGGANFFVSRTGQTGGLYIESDGTNGVIRNPASNPILFQTNGANTRASVTNDGITFNGDTAAANALDDYEEGTWNPTLIAGTTNPTGGAYQARNGRYLKIGNRVFVTFYVGISWTNSPSGGIYVGNLPYTVANDATTATHFPIVSYKLDLNGVGAFGVALQNQTNVQLYVMANAGTWSALSWDSHAYTPLYIAGEFSYAVS